MDTDPQVPVVCCLSSWTSSCPCVVCYSCSTAGVGNTSSFAARNCGHQVLASKAKECLAANEGLLVAETPKALSVTCAWLTLVTMCKECEHSIRTRFMKLNNARK
eukprot:521376-Amphidinium_carterae.1